EQDGSGRELLQIWMDCNAGPPRFVVVGKRPAEWKARATSAAWGNRTLHLIYHQLSCVPSLWPLAARAKTNKGRQSGETVSRLASIGCENSQSSPRDSLDQSPIDPVRGSSSSRFRSSFLFRHQPDRADMFGFEPITQGTCQSILVFLNGLRVFRKTDSIYGNPSWKDSRACLSVICASGLSFSYGRRAGFFPPYEILHAG
ncbi:hypothetical protein BaRGS_00027732, partial [Batillaria attramentaria]